MRRFSIREDEESEKESRRLAIFLGVLTLGIIVALVFWGIPLLVGLANFLGTFHKAEPETISEDTIPPVPPQFAAVPEATNTATIKIEGSSEPESKVAVYLNEEALITTQAGKNGEFQVGEITLRQGENFLTALAIDQAGNQSGISKGTRVIFDDEPPTLELTEPKSAIFYESKIEVKGKAESEEIRVTINNHLVLLEKEGNFIYPFELAEGKNTIHVVAEDLASNKTEKTIEVVYKL